MKLLIIEDEIDLARLIQRGLRKKGYLADVCHDGLEGLETALINSYDALILDLNLPTMDGLDVLKALRKEGRDTRVLILSARSEIEDRVLGLELGASDYLPKPFDFRELEARIDALLRRKFVQLGQRIKLKGIYIDVRMRKIYDTEHNPVEISPREYSLLEYLALHAGRVVSAEELIEHVWSSDVDSFTASVKTHISSLRKKLLPVCGCDPIETVRGSGYLIKTEDEA
jgi:DNA-binding response OmpR family regulator